MKLFSESVGFWEFIQSTNMTQKKISFIQPFEHCPIWRKFEVFSGCKAIIPDAFWLLNMNQASISQVVVVLKRHIPISISTIIDVVFRYGLNFCTISRIFLEARVTQSHFSKFWTSLGSCRFRKVMEDSSFSVLECFWRFLNVLDGYWRYLKV